MAEFVCNLLFIVVIQVVRNIIIFVKDFICFHLDDERYDR